MNYDYQTLEFYDFLNTLKTSFISSFAQKSINNIAPLPDIHAIKSTQLIYNESILLATDDQYIQKDEDAFHSINKLMNIDYSYEPKDLINLANFLIYITDIRDRLLTNNKVNYLKPLLITIDTLTDLSKIIKDSIDDNGLIRDNATPELKEIRSDINIYKDRVLKNLKQIINSSNASKFINEDTITTHNGRYTISCKTNYHQYIQGIIQDKSFSGQTLYIEPSSAISLNNALQELIIKESEEIAKIIYSIIKLFKSLSEEISVLIENYTILSIYLEIGYFYRDKNVCFGELSDRLKFIDMHHPLLYLRGDIESIPIDFDLGRDKSLAVITGPNTGGKTAALKSVGLNLIIIYSGLPIFAKSAEYTFYENILADIGDKQSLMMDLSTFSSHMLNIKNIISVSNNHSLLLFDELGTGTDASEGAALAIAIVTYLLQLESNIIITTHFKEVKNFALGNDRAIFYAVDFDYDTFEPRYKLLRDIIGRSDPILIAKRLGFLKEVIDLADIEIAKYRSSLELTLEEINREKAENQHLTKKLEVWEKTLSEKELMLTESDTLLKKRLDSKELELLSETYQLLQQSRRLVKERERELERGKSKDNQDMSQLNEDIDIVEKKMLNIKSRLEKIEDLKIGDIVYIDSYKAKAKVIGIRKDIFQLDINGLRINFKSNEMIGKKILKKDKLVKPKIKTEIITKPIRGEIVLVGKRVEESLDLLDIYINQAVVDSYETIAIVHGRGTGQLRKAVHEYLRTNSSIKSYRLAGSNEGGVAITIATL